MLELLLAIGLATSPAPVAPVVPPPPPPAPIDDASEGTEPPPVTPGRLTTDYSFTQPNRVELADGVTTVSTDTNNPSPRFGFSVMRVNIDNSAGPKQQIALSFNPTGSNGTHPVRRTVEVQAGERRAATMLVPYAMRYGEFRADGPGVRAKSKVYVYFNPIYSAARLVLNLGTPDEFEKAAGVAASHTPADLQVQSIPAEDAPTELAAYVGFDAVTIPKASLDTLSEGARRALEAYAASGGTVVMPNAGRALGAYFPLVQLKEGRFQSYGEGRIDGCAACGALPLTELAETVTKRDPPVNPNGVRPVYGRYYAPPPPGGATTPLLAQASVPVGRFLAIISIFTLLIGPGSLYVARRRGPAALLVTIPGIAFATCLLIIGSSIAEDGFSVHAASYGYTELDAPRHRAITVGVNAYYANLPPSGAKFDTLTAVLGPFDSGETYGAAMDWAEGSATAGSDFLPPRSYREWAFQSVAQTRARVVVKKSPDGTVTVQNALGMPLDAITVRVGNTAYRVGPLSDGAEGKASPIGNSLSNFETGVSNRFSAELRNRIAAPLGTNQFFAEATGPGFMPVGGLRLNFDRSQQLIRGSFE